MSELQELYKHLDHSTNGDRYIAYYGQCRAKGYGHAKAIKETVDYFNLSAQPWYKARF